MGKGYNNVLTSSLRGGGTNNTIVCYNDIKRGFKQLDSFSRAILKEGMHYE